MISKKISFLLKIISSWEYVFFDFECKSAQKIVYEKYINREMITKEVSWAKPVEMLPENKKIISKNFIKIKVKLHFETLSFHIDYYISKYISGQNNVF